MKKITFITLSLFGLFAFTFNQLDDNEPEVKTQKTGIYIDSMSNEVLLVFEDLLPAYYKSEIFTPVCNTGECLPVYVNIYWSLNGQYLKFDQPENEILTKLDHVPFTEDDYELLDEILKGPDPRLASLSQGENHSQVKHDKGDKEDAQAMPAPSVNTIKMDKYAMVDGISGATLPEVKSQFVPGALYTTYTLWGLANDSKNKIKKYTKDHLFPKYSKHLIGDENLECAADVIDWMASKSNNENARAQVLIDLIDSRDTLIQAAALSQMYFNYYSLPEIQAVLDRTFYSESTFMIQRHIIWDWAYNYTPASTLIKLSDNLINYEQHFPEMMAVFENKTEYPDGVVRNMALAYPKLKPANQQIMRDFVVKQKDYFSDEDWEIVKAFIE